MSKDKERYSEITVYDEPMGWRCVGFDELKNEERELDVQFYQLVYWAKDYYDLHWWGDAQSMLSKMDEFQIRDEIKKYFKDKMSQP